MWKFLSSSLWLRAAVALSSAWLLIGMAIYIYSLGHDEGDANAYEKLPPPLAWWSIVCAKIGIPVFSFVGGGLRMQNGEFEFGSFELEFNSLGFALFLLGPLLFFWIFLFALIWVLKGHPFSKLR